MGRYKKTIPPRKEHFIGVRITEDLYDVISYEADKAGISISEYFRRLATNHTINVQEVIVMDNSKLLEILGGMGKIGSNLNQIARHLNEGREWNEKLKNEISSALSDLVEIRNGIRTMTGDYNGNNKAPIN